MKITFSIKSALITLLFLVLGSQPGKVHSQTAYHFESETAYNPAMYRMVGNAFDATIPDVLYSSDWVQLEGLGELRLNMRKDGTHNLHSWVTNEGEIHTTIDFCFGYELFFSKVTIRKPLLRPKKSPLKGVLKNVRKGEEILWDPKYRQFLEAKGKIRLKIYPNLLGSEYIHARTRVEDEWYGEVKPRVLFYEIDLRTRCLNQMRPHFQRFANAIQDSLKADLSLIADRFVAWEENLASVFTTPSKQLATFPFKIRDLNEIRNLCPKKQIDIKRLQGLWKIKVKAHPYNGKFGNFKGSLLLRADDAGQWTDFSFTINDIKANLFDSPEELELLMREGVERWQQEQGYESYQIQMHETDDPYFNFYLIVTGQKPGSDMVFPIVAASHRKIFAVYFNNGGEIVLAPLYKVKG